MPAALATSPQVSSAGHPLTHRVLDLATYGKTFHTWQYDRDDFPYGIPQLMMGFTGDGQADEELLRARDRRLGLSTRKRRRRRAGIPMPELVPGANVWESGRTVQTSLDEVDFRGQA